MPQAQPIISDFFSRMEGNHNERDDHENGARAGEPIKVTYSYDTNGKMHCIFEEAKSKKKIEMNLKPEGSKEIKELRSDMSKGKGAINLLIIIGGVVGALVGFFNMDG